MYVIKLNWWCIFWFIIFTIWQTNKQNNRIWYQWNWLSGTFLIKSYISGEDFVSGTHRVNWFHKIGNLIRWDILIKTAENITCYVSLNSNIYWVLSTQSYLMLNNVDETGPFQFRCGQIGMLKLASEEALVWFFF